MKEVEITAQTEQEAVEQALKELNITRERAEISDVREDSESGSVTVKVKAIESEDSDVSPIAKSILETLLDKAGVDASVEILTAETVIPDEDAGSGVVYNIRGNDLGILIGRKGQTLTSLQYLIRLIVAHRTGIYAPIVLDVNDYRRRRFDALKSMALKVAEQVKEKKMPFSLEPMPAFDRRIVHLVLADDPIVTTQSVGNGEDRKVVVVLREPED